MLACLVSLPLLYAQRPMVEAGSRTIPYKVVYKLKPLQLQLARSGKGASMSQALQQIGAKKVAQKFPEVAAAQSLAAARLATPAVDLSLIYELEYTPGYTYEQVRTLLLNTGQVAYVEPLYIREPLHQPNDPASDSTKTTQYYLKQIKAYAGWAVEKGDTNTVIGVLDTGFRLTHQDLKTKVKHNYADPIDGIDNDGDGYIDNFSGWDFADKDNNVTDDTPWKGHGTAVAGVAAAATNNGLGIAGTGYNSKFLPLKVFSSYANGAFGGYEAIVYAANKGCKVINLSWGGSDYSQFEQDVINYAVLVKDALIIASGGNTNAFINIYPASYDNVLSVGGANNQDVKYKDHTYNYKIDLISPSSGIYSTSVSSDSRYGYVGGTSFAAPTVAGGAALVRKRYPELSAVQVAERLRASTDPIYQLEGNQPYLEMLGTGRFNLKKALKSESLKSVRCVAFTPRPRQQMGAGENVLIDAAFTNYLTPTQNLKVSLTALSPYVTIEQANLNPGAVATMGSFTTGDHPFIIKVAENAPTNLTVYLRVGFSDGNYSDFQHFELIVNPDYVTLTANNLHLTLNSYGNIGYNGLNFKQGVGASYKESASLLFEGGLMLATEDGFVADNLHNDSWKNDSDFKNLSLIKLAYDTPLADQEVRTLMQTNLEGHPTIDIKTIGYAWATKPDQDYVIVEYQLTNRSEKMIQELHAGLYADWDIGSYTQNMAGWNDDLQLGYVYNSAKPLPFAGLKLLTPEEKIIYHASDNINGNDSTVAIDDGFSNEEKYKIISNGKSRLRAGGETGNSVSHVLGGTALNLAPGETKVIAFAVLAGDDLSSLQAHALAAQQKYKSIKTGPAPVATNYEICPYSPVVIAPTGGSKFNFYADASANELLASGASFTIPSAQQSRTIYVINADSLFKSESVPMQVNVVPFPKASFAQLPMDLQTGEELSLTDESENAVSWKWRFGDGDSAQVQHPTHTYKKPGTYEVELMVTNKLSCTVSSYSRTIHVYDTEPTLYPNPTSGSLTLTLTSPLSLDAMPELQFTDVSGKAVPVVSTGSDETHFYYDLSHLKAGIYIARTLYQDKVYVERILIGK
ncbi:S8 family serine peptidase [Pontibacter oryzae]|uniref:S8 family serine peptidase n=1 Tax=Pontibacter oryzae TaxID=2304593 RepID=UPI001F1CA645|nr:S8 family serine peptidase [Pontibacter oryzae]